MSALHASSQSLQERKEQRIQAQLEEERRLREFKAKPIPSSTNSGSGVGSLPEVPVREPTKPQPFDLEIERRVGDRLNNWKEAVEQVMSIQIVKIQFQTYFHSFCNFKTTILIESK